MSDDDRKSSTVSSNRLPVVVVLAYLTPPLAIFFDEVVFRTVFIWSVTPKWVLEVLGIVYYPFKLIFGK